MEHYNGGESYNGVLVLPLRKFRQLCKDCGYMDDRTGEKFGKKLSAGNVAVAYQTAVSHVQPAFGLNGVHKGAVTTLERIEELLWKPTKKSKVSLPSGTAVEFQRQHPSVCSFPHPHTLFSRRTRRNLWSLPQETFPKRRSSCKRSSTGAEARPTRTGSWCHASFAPRLWTSL